MLRKNFGWLFTWATWQRLVHMISVSAQYCRAQYSTAVGQQKCPCSILIKKNKGKRRRVLAWTTGLCLMCSIFLTIRRFWHITWTEDQNLVSYAAMHEIKHANTLVCHVYWSICAIFALLSFQFGRDAARKCNRETSCYDDGKNIFYIYSTLLASVGETLPC